MKKKLANAADIRPEDLVTSIKDIDNRVLAQALGLAYHMGAQAAKTNQPIPSETDFSRIALKAACDAAAAKVIELRHAMDEAGDLLIKIANLLRDVDADGQQKSPSGEGR